MKTQSPLQLFVAKYNIFLWFLYLKKSTFWRQGFTVLLINSCANYFLNYSFVLWSLRKQWKCPSQFLKVREDVFKCIEHQSQRQIHWSLIWSKRIEVSDKLKCSFRLKCNTPPQLNKCALWESRSSCAYGHTWYLQRNDKRGREMGVCQSRWLLVFLKIFQHKKGKSWRIFTLNLFCKHQSPALLTTVRIHHVSHQWQQLKKRKSIYCRLARSHGGRSCCCLSAWGTPGNCSLPSSQSYSVSTKTIHVVFVQCNGFSDYNDIL